MLYIHEWSNILSLSLSLSLFEALSLFLSPCMHAGVFEWVTISIMIYLYMHACTHKQKSTPKIATCRLQGKHALSTGVNYWKFFLLCKQVQYQNLKRRIISANKKRTSTSHDEDRLRADSQWKSHRMRQTPDWSNVIWAGNSKCIGRTCACQVCALISVAFTDGLKYTHHDLFAFYHVSQAQ